jgi:hypothetical protein
VLLPMVWDRDYLISVVGSTVTVCVDTYLRYGTVPVQVATGTGIVLLGLAQCCRSAWESDPAYDFGADPDPACHFDADPDPDPTFHFFATPDPDPSVRTPDQDPSFQINVLHRTMLIGNFALKLVLDQGMVPYRILNIPYSLVKPK